MMNRIGRTLLISALMAVSAFARADEAAPAASQPPAETKPAVARETAIGRAAVPESAAAVATTEVLPGNGSRAGYVLGHSSVVPESEWVYVGARRAIRNKDYTIDYASGTLFFTEPVRSTDSVRVDYRYVPSARGERSVASPGALPLMLGKNLQMNMLYSYRAGDADLGIGSPDILTYGVNSVTKLGETSQVSSLMYMSTPHRSTRMSITANPKAPGKNTQPPKRDKLMLQDADLGLGKVRLKLGFQDVGEDFAGFASMRESKSAPDDVLAMLEKEKGIKRMSFAAEVPSAGGALNLSMGRIEDKGDEISTRAASYSTDRVKLDFSTREVGRGFTRFKSLREADAAQMAAEAGLKRSSYGLQFRTGAGADGAPVWSGLRFTELEGDTGSLSWRSADLDLGMVKVQADVRKMDPQFNRMAALTDEERTRMALIARRQFNPAALASDVTAQDKAKVNQEAGLDRSSYLVRVDDSWLSLSSVDSEKGGLNRSAVEIKKKRFGAYFTAHHIDQTFDRLSNLQPVELERYGNEYGMSRTEFGGRLALAGGEASLRSASVEDHQGAQVQRRSFDFASPRLKFRANFQDIDPRFSRIMDLSDSDRKLLVQERGFSRRDYTLKWQVTRGLSIDSYVYDSTNVTEGQTRSQDRHQIVYAPDKTREISLFMDDYSYVSETGNISSYSRRKFNLNQTFSGLGATMAFRSLNDVNAIHEADGRPVTTTISQYRVESDQASPTSFTLDMLDIDYGDGRFADTRGIGFKTRALKNLSLVGSYAQTHRESGPPEGNGSFGMEWVVSKDLALMFKMANRDGGAQGSRQEHSFTMKGLLAHRLLWFRDIKVDTSSNSTVLTGRQIGCDNGLKLEAGFLGGSLLFDNSDKLNPKNGIYYTSRVFQYQSDSNPDKWYHLTLFRQNLTTPSGQPARKRNYAMDMRLSPATKFTLASHYGKDGKNGEVIAVGGTVLKLSHQLGKEMSLVADYSMDVNDETQRRAAVSGIGILGKLAGKDAFELYVGRAELTEKLCAESKLVFRVKYDHKVDADRFLTLTAERKSGVDKTSINPYEGDTTARLDFRTTFN